MKPTFSEHRLLNLSAEAPEPSIDAIDAAPIAPAEAPTTPDAAAADIENAVQDLDANSQESLARMGIKAEELRGQNIDKLEDASDSTKFIEGTREVANALSEVRQIMQMVLKLIDMINNPDKFKQKPGQKTEGVKTAPAETGRSSRESVSNSLDVNLTEAEQNAIAEHLNGKPAETSEQQAEENEAKETQLEGERKAAVEEKRGLEDQKTDLESQLRDTEDEFERSSLERQITKLDKQISAVDDMIADIDQELDNLQTEPEETEDTSEALESAREKLQQAVDQMNETLQATINQLPEGELKTLVTGLYLELNPDTFELGIVVNDQFAQVLENQGLDSTSIEDVTYYLDNMEEAPKNEGAQPEEPEESAETSLGRAKDAPIGQIRQDTDGNYWQKGETGWGTYNNPDAGMNSDSGFEGTTWGDSLMDERGVSTVDVPEPITSTTPVAPDEFINQVQPEPALEEYAIATETPISAQVQSEPALDTSGLEAATNETTEAIDIGEIPVDQPEFQPDIAMNVDMDNLNGSTTA